MRRALSWTLHWLGEVFFHLEQWCFITSEAIQGNTDKGPWFGQRDQPPEE